MKLLFLLVALSALFFSANALKHEICGLPHSLDGDGRMACEALFHKWSYNAAENKCVHFIFGGCGGNANQFDTQNGCEEKCLE